MIMAAAFGGEGAREQAQTLIQELRKKYKRMNDYSKFSINGKGKKRHGSEKLAMEIQLLQRDLKGSMAFHIKLVKPLS